MKTTINRADVESLLTGYHASPSAVLGLHLTELGSEIRVMMLDATKVEVLATTTEQVLSELECIDDRGFFVGLLPHSEKPLAITLDKPNDSIPYKLKIYWQEQFSIVYDPYCFPSLIKELDEWLFVEGSHFQTYNKLGAHITENKGIAGANFVVWAPNAQRVSIVGDFNFWHGLRNPMNFNQNIGMWEIFIPEIGEYTNYKFEILDSNGNIQLKADPYAFYSELRPETASKVFNLPADQKVSATVREANQFNKPISIYEVHLGSWRRNIENNYWLTYAQLEKELIPYVKDMGFTHIEFLPMSEYPFDGSWGYQPLGLYSPTSRFGTPDEFRSLIQACHAAGINVILDWVPGHFPTDAYGLAKYDGTSLYEYQDPREGFHQDWNTLIYNYGRHEVNNFLVSNAMYWIKKFGIDGIRVDAVSSMIYRDYSRAEGEWIPNAYGGRENIEAIEFLKRVNYLISTETAGAISIAEESTSFANVTKPPEDGGLGFHYKWNMGWMNDSLAYMQLDPIYRKYNHDKLTFAMVYNYTENFVLPLSHDEVVHGKGSILDKMPGDVWQKFANVRAYYAYMWTFPGKKLLFMGNEFAQGKEWDYNESLDWYLLEEECGGNWHKGVQSLVRDLNKIYTTTPALYELDYDPAGFEWLVVDDCENSVYVFERKDSQNNACIVISNFTPEVRYNYRFGVNKAGIYQEILNTDSHFYNGSNVGNYGEIQTANIASHAKDVSIEITIPPLATIILQYITDEIVNTTFVSDSNIIVQAVAN